MAETDHYVIVDKPALLDSQNSRAGRPSVVAWLTDRFGFAGLVHRLDFGTSGLMVCAKDAGAARLLTAELQQGKITRIYLAVVLGKILPNAGEWNTPVDDQPALTRFRVIERFANASLIECELETGRNHQIRRHAAAAGHPLLGDHLYGRKGAQRLFHRPALHAARLRVRRHEYTSPRPADLAALITRLKG